METPAGHKPQAWAILAAAHGGTAVGNRRGRIKAVRLPHGDWEITLDRYVVSTGNTRTEYTRLRVPMRTRTNFRMRIFRENVFTRIAKWFGMSDVTVPDPEIDRQFIVQTDVASLANTLVLDRQFARALLALPRGRLEVVPVRRRGRRVPDAAELRWLTKGILQDAEKLENALELVRATLDCLIRSGVAREMGEQKKLP